MEAKETFKKAVDEGLIEKVSGVFVLDPKGESTPLGKNPKEALEILGEEGIIKLEASLIEKANLDAEAAEKADDTQEPPVDSDIPDSPEDKAKDDAPKVEVDRYMFKNPKMANGNTGLRIGTSMVRERMVNFKWNKKGICEPEMSKEEYPLVAELLKKGGAVDISQLVKVAPVIVAEVQGPIQHTLMHPEGPETSGQVFAGGKPVQVVDGIVETDDFLVSQELEKKGFILILEEEEEDQ